MAVGSGRKILVPSFMSPPVLRVRHKLPLTIEVHMAAEAVDFKKAMHLETPF